MSESSPDFIHDSRVTLALGLGGGLLLGMLLAKRFLPTMPTNVEVMQKAAKNISHMIMAGDELKMVLVVRTDLGMGRGKMAAQCCHAALNNVEIATKKTPKMLEQWYAVGQMKVVVKVDSEKELSELYAKARNLGVVAGVVRDAGRTQIAAGSITVLGLGPGPKPLIDQISGHLKLM